MKVVIDGVPYAPMYSAEDYKGEVKSVHRLFTEARKHEGWTVAVASKETGVPPWKITQAEAGTMSVDTLFRLAYGYKIPIDQIQIAVLRKRI